MEQPHTDAATMPGLSSSTCNLDKPYHHKKNKQKSCRRGLPWFISYKREGGRSIILPTAFNVGRCCRSLPTWVSKHTTSLACRALAHLALGLTGAEVARAVRLCKDDAAKCCAWTTLIQHSCTGADTGAGEQNKASAEEKHIPYSPEVLGLQSQISLLST